MSKIKIYELAKELKVTSREVIELLGKKNIEVKSHMSSIENTEADQVRGSFAKAAKPAEKPAEKTSAKPAENAAEKPAEKVAKKSVEKAAEKPAEKPEEAPKKKNIVHVFRPQNTQKGVRQGGNRQKGKGLHMPGKLMQVNNGRPAKGVPVQKPEQPARKPVEKPETEKAAVKKAETEVKAVAAKPQATDKLQAAEKSQSLSPTRPAESRPQTVQVSQKPQEENRQKAAGDRAQGDRKAQGTGERQGRLRDKNGERGQGAGARSGRPGERQSRFADKNGERGQGAGTRSGRPGERQGRFGDRSNDRNQGGGARSGRPGERQGRFGDRDRDNRGRDRDRGPGMGARPDDRRGGRRNDSSAIPAPAIEAQKTQRSKGKGKDDHKKKDYRRDEEERMPKGKGRKNDAKPQMQKPQQKQQQAEETIKSIIIPEMLTIKELADKMKIVPSVIIKKLFMQGKVATVNQEVDYATAEEIALEFDILCEKEEVVDVIEELLKEEEEDVKKMKKRPPVVCVMGHVDHGKTSLLDAIRHTNVIGGEAGGITQHIGAYVVEVNGERITFLDTPGHEAFTAMRMRGASSTDIAILVVAADDGVMPQTVEAINHAKAAGVEIIVAVNKIDKPSANIERVKQELTEYELIPEDWGGSTVFVPVSAKTGEGLEDLMEMIVLTAEVMELKANPNRRARGLVLEAQLDKGRGSVATVLVQKGTLRIGDAVAAGSAFGKVRAMMDDKGRRVKEAGPSVPVEILGLNDVPNAGEVFVGCGNDKEARNFAETFISQSKMKLLEETKSKLSLDDLFNQIQEGNLKELGIVVKADVQGSVEAIKQSLLKLSNDEVVVKIIHGGVGAINESDVSLASASNAIIIGFNVRPDATAKDTADREGVDIRLYRVIYNAIEDVEAAMKGMLDPVFEEKVLGHAEVRQLFKASGVGTIAGSYVLDGVFERDCSVRITRDGVVVFEGALASLRRFKDDVKEVRTGYECGFVFANFNDVKEGDIVEAFKMVEIPR